MCLVKSNCLPVPVCFRVLVQRLEYNRQDLIRVVVNQVDNVLVVPIIQCPLSNLLANVKKNHECRSRESVQIKGRFGKMQVKTRSSCMCSNSPGSADLRRNGRFA